MKHLHWILIILILSFACSSKYVAVAGSKNQRSSARIIDRLSPASDSSITVTGVIRDDLEHLIGAKVSNNKSTVHTDLDGYFKLHIPSSQTGRLDSIFISYLGYTTLSLAISDIANMRLEIILSQTRELGCP